MRRSSDFGAAVRRGRRAGGRTVVVHVLAGEGSSQAPVVVGLVVSKAVGGAVVRNRTKRRLRALMRPLLPRLAPGTRLVVRAQPAAALAPTPALGHDLARALDRACALISTVQP
jgi:ribonuclease P protein component